MSTSVDQRVVQMEFDNKNFEKNVSTTLSSLDKLKQKLGFEGATKGLENVENAAKKVNLSPVTKAVETISSKFSALEVMSVTALANITNSAVNAGKKIISAFTIDPVKTGFQEYETQINAVQTILANTESKGSTLEDVNKALDTLNKYADKTIYNFTEMTRNIGTFTAAGVDLDTSVSAIKGIANLAAVSGSTSQQASTAMYQLSQALAAGTVKLMDWNSVVNAGMGGQVFQDALKETARVHGIAIDQMIKDEGSFRETLKNGWLTSEVLTETLSKFTGDLNESQLRTMGYTEEQIKSIIKMGQTANDAATKVKTFSQLFDTLKEAAQSGWTQTWELIVGDFEEAKAFLTMLSDRFSAIINKTSDARNNLLEGALSAKKVTMEDWKKLQNEGIASETFILALTNAAKKHGVAIDEMIEKEGSFQNTLKNGWLNFDILASALTDYEDAVTASTTNMADKLEYFQSVVDKVWNGDYSTGAERIKALSEAGYDYATVQDLVNKTVDGHRLTLEDLSEAQMENLGFTEAQIQELKALKEQAEKTGTPLNELITKLQKPAGRTLLIESLTNALDGLGLILGKIGKVWRAVFDPVTSDDLYGFIQRIHELSKKFAECNDFANKLARVFRGLFAAMDLVRSIVGGAVKTAFTVLCKLLGIAGDSVLDLAGGLADTVFYFNKWVKENDLITRGFNKLIDVISIAISTVSKWIDEIMKLPIVSNTVQKVKDAIGFFVTDIRDYFQKGKESVKDFAENVGGLGGVNFDAITNKLTVAASKARTIPQMFTTLIESIQSALTGFRKGLNDKFSEIGTTFDAFGKRVTSFVDHIRSKFSNLTFGKVFATASIIGLVVSAKKIGDAIEAFAAPLEAITGILQTFEKVEKAAVKLIKSISSAFKSVSHVLNAAALIEMAVAVSIFAGAIALLAKIDKDKLGNAVGAITILMVAMTGLFGVVAAFGSIKKTSFQEVAIVMATLGAAVLALAGALKILDGLNGNTIVKNALVLGGLATALVALVGVLGKFIPQLTKGSITFVAVAASVKILVEALATLDTLNTDTVMNNATAMLNIMTTLAIVMGVCGNVRVGAAVTLISLVLSLKLLLTAFDDLAEMDPIIIEKSLASIKRIFESFALVMVASKLAGQNAGRAGLGILAMSTSLLVISGAIAIIGNMETAIITRATMVIQDIFAMFALLVAASALAGKNAARAGAMMLMMSASLLILTGVIAILTQIGKETPDAMDNAVSAIIKLELCFTILVAVSKLAAGSKGTIIALSVAIGILSATLAALSIIKPDGLYPATIAISTLMGMLALVVASTHLAQKSIATLITVTAVVAVLAIILAKLNGLDANTSIATAGSLSILLLSLSAACAILATMGKSGGIVTGALAGAAALDVFIVMIGAIIYGLGAMFTGENAILLEEVLNKGIVILEKIGTGLGSFIGGIWGGIAKGTLAGVGQGLSDFMTNLQGFIDGAKQIDDKAISGIKGLAETMLILTGSSIVSGIASIFGGGVSLAVFATEMSEAAPKLKQYAEDVKGVDFSGVEASANAAKMMAEFARHIPNQGGLLSKIVGDNPIVVFAANLATLADPLVEYAGKVKGVDFSSVEASANAALLIARFADNIPNQGGILAEWVGDNSIKMFVEDLATLADPLVEYAGKVKGVDFSSVEASTNAALMIAKFAENIPNQGGVLADWIGDNTLSEFGLELSKFATPLVVYANMVKDVKFDGVQGSVAAAQMLSGLADNLPNYQVVSDWFTGKITLSEFGKQIALFGGSFNTYYNNVKDVKPGVVIVTTLAAESLATLAKNLPEDKWFKNDTIDGFGKDLAKFGKKFAEYYNKVKDVDTGKLSAVVKETENVIKMAKGTASVDTAKFGSFGEALTKVGGNGLNSFLKSFSDASSKIESAGKKVLDDFTKGINSKDKKTSLLNALNDIIKASLKKIDDFKDSFETAGKNLIAKLEDGTKSKDKVSSLKTAVTNLIKGIIKIFGDYDDEAYDAGEDFVKGFAKGIDENTWRAEAKAKAMAEASLEAARKELDEHSPSKKTFDIGENWGEGLVLGMDSKQDKVVKAAAETATVTVDPLQKTSLAMFEVGESWGNSLALGMDSTKNTVQESSTKVASIPVDPLRKMYKAEDEILGKSTDNSRSYWKEKIKTTESSTSKVMTIFGDTIEVAKEKSSGALSKITDVFSSGENLLSKGLEKLTGYNTDSLSEQTSYWTNSNAINQNGVENILSTQDNLLEGLETTSEEVEEIHEDDLANETGYWANLLRIKRQGAEAEKYQAMSLAEFQKETLDKTLELYNNYYDELSSKTQSFMNATSLFNAVSKSEETISKTDLVTNLKGQIMELYDYGTVIQTLEKRLSGTRLWEYVKDLGTESISELQAINSMTDAELSTYAETYNIKYTLAAANARNQLKGLKESTETSLDELYGITGTKLDEFSEQFDGTFESLTAYVEKAAEIGANISAGVATGMVENTEEIDNAAGKMIENVEEAAKEAAEIHSPSERFKREVGVNIVKGIALGIESMDTSVSDALLTIMANALNRLKSKYEDFKMGGATLVDGLIDGIRSKAEQAIAEARSLANSVRSAINSAMSGINLSPTITPKIDLTNSIFKASKLDLSYSASKASSVNSSMNKSSSNNSNSGKNKSTGNTYTFTQNNYSPKSLSSTDIYRQTKNQFTAIERMLET